MKNNTESEKKRNLLKTTFYIRFKVRGYVCFPYTKHIAASLVVQITQPLQNPNGRHFEY